MQYISFLTPLHTSWLTYLIEPPTHTMDMYIPAFNTIHHPTAHPYIITHRPGTQAADYHSRLQAHCNHSLTEDNTAPIVAKQTFPQLLSQQQSRPSHSCHPMRQQPVPRHSSAPDALLSNMAIPAWQPVVGGCDRSTGPTTHHRGASQAPGRSLASTS